jgi:hypothetical protein
MSFKFFVWGIHFPTGRRIKEACESWPSPVCGPADAATAFARDYVAKWSADDFFPDHPVRDAEGRIILPDSIDQAPEDYLAAHEPPAPAPEPRPRLPMSGPMNIVTGPGAAPAGMRAAYEASRRGLKPWNVKPPAPPYEPPPSPVSSHTPSLTPNDPPIPPRTYEPDPAHPKYGRNTGHIAGRRARAEG